MEIALGAALALLGTVVGTVVLEWLTGRRLERHLAEERMRKLRGLAYELISRGELPALRLGRVLRVPRQGLEQWISRQAGLASASPGELPSPGSGLATAE